MVLVCSRLMFVRPVVAMDQQSWTGAHVAAFDFLGGVPARLVPDNLKTDVDKPDLYDPKINRAYAELAAHYGVLADPARALKPKDKPRVERPMPYVRDSFWRGRDFAWGWKIICVSGWPDRDADGFRFPRKDTLREHVSGVVVGAGDRG